MNPKELSSEMVRAVRTDRVDAAFSSGEVFAAPDDLLFEYLQTLSTGFVPNTNVQHREIIRGLTINHIQMRRLIDRLDRQNQKTTFWFMVLALAGVISAIVQILIEVAD